MANRVFNEMICPECGGKIGAQPGDGHQPCKCFVETKRPAASAAAPMKPPEPEGPTKVCRVCGKDLTGRARLKDDRGYLCKPCADIEDAKEADFIKCPECDRRLKPDAFVMYRGTSICRKCNAYHQETDKTLVGKVELKGHDEHERRSVKRLLIFAGVLVLLCILAMTKTLLKL